MSTTTFTIDGVPITITVNDSGTFVAGPPGVDGKEVEIQNSGTYIQWRYVGDSSWTNLVPLADLKGDTGAQGIQGIQGIQGPKGDTGAQGNTGADGHSPTVAFGTGNDADRLSIDGVVT